MWNLRISMILFGAIQMAEGLVMWILPGRVYEYVGFGDLYIASDVSNFIAYIMAIAGAALISGGCLFLIGSFNPMKNVNAVRFAILWSALILAGQIYSIAKDYVTFGHIWWNLVVTAIFLLAFFIFFPWPWRRQSYK
jgi:hypothetical protein